MVSAGSPRRQVLTSHLPVNCKNVHGDIYKVEHVTEEELVCPPIMAIPEISKVELDVSILVNSGLVKSY